jgi:hypothetical protein
MSFVAWIPVGLVSGFIAITDTGGALLSASLVTMAVACGTGNSSNSSCEDACNHALQCQAELEAEGATANETGNLTLSFCLGICESPGICGGSAGQQYFINCFDGISCTSASDFSRQWQYCENEEC